MSKHIFEEKPAEGGAPAQMGNAKAVIEKKARQLAYDTRYQVKREMGDKKADPATLQRALITRLQKSNAIPAVKMRAKQMLLGEDYISDLGDLAANTVANALYKVFVEGVQKEEVIELDYLKELAENPDKKYKVSVFDPKSETRYVRYATREKISQLRAKGLKVELTEYGEPRESEAKKGSQTAAALGGGKAKKDYDGDGKVESGAKEHAGAVHNAIQRKKGGVPDGQDTSSVKEELIVDAAATQDQNERKITGKGVNNSRLIKIMPEDGAEPISARGSMTMSYELGGEVLSEKAVSKAQQKFMGMVYAAKKGAPAASPEVAKAAAGMSKGEAKKFAKTKHKGLPVHKEDAECDTDSKKKDDKKVDLRSIPTTTNLIKNKLRAMGLKMSQELKGNELQEKSGDGYIGPTPIPNPIRLAQDAVDATNRSNQKTVDAVNKQLPGSASMPKNVTYFNKGPSAASQKYLGLKNSYEPEGELVDESSASDDAMAEVKKRTAKEFGAKAIVGSAANKRAQASQSKPTKPKRKLPGYSIPGAPPEKSYHD